MFIHTLMLCSKIITNLTKYICVGSQLVCGSHMNFLTYAFCASCQNRQKDKSRKIENYLRILYRNGYIVFLRLIGFITTLDQVIMRSSMALIPISVKILI